MALLPPSSRIVRPKRGPTTSAMRRPMRQLPVAEISGTRRSASMMSPTSLPRPTTRLKTPGQSNSFMTSSQIFCTAIAQSGTLLEGFHTIVSPQTAASAAFHAHTATGKLNALTTPTTPSGCHCSYMRWPGRSLCIASP